MPRRWDINGKLIEDAQAAPAKRRWDAAGNLVSEAPAAPAGNILRERTWPEAIGLTGLRVGGTALGGLVGLLGANPLTVAAGGVAGSAAGELGAQALEQKWGIRKDISPGVVATEAALGAFAPGKAASLGRRALWGAGQAVASTAGRTVGEEGRLPTVGEAGTAAAMGGGMGALAAKVLPGKTLKPAQAAPEAPAAPIRRSGGGTAPVAPASSVVPPKSPTQFADQPDDIIRQLYDRIHGAPMPADPAKAALAADLLKEARRRNIGPSEAPPVPFRPGARVVPQGQSEAAPVPTGKPKVVDPYKTEKAPDGGERLKFYRSIEQEAPTTATAARMRAVMAQSPEATSGLKTKTVAEIRQGANSVKVEAIPIGQNFKNAEQAVAHMRRDVSQVLRHDELAAKVPDHTITPAEAQELAGIQRSLPSYIRESLSAKSEAGRTMRAFQIPIEGRLVTVPEAGITAAIKLGMSDQEISRIVKTAGNNTDEWYNALRARASADMGVQDKLKAFVTGNILSGPLTWLVRNPVGNTTNIAARFLTLPIEGAIDRMATPAGKARTVRASEVGPQFKAMMEAVGPAWEKFKFVLKKGYIPGEVAAQPSLGGLDTPELGKMVSAGTYGGFDSPSPELPGKLFAAHNYLRRMMEGQDVFFRHIASEMDLAGQAHTKALNTGVKQGSGQYDELTKLLRLNPTADMQKMATEIGARGTYQEKAGEVTNIGLDMKRKIPWLWNFLNFVKTPGMIIKQGVESTPLGFLMKDAGLVVKTDAKGRAILPTNPRIQRMVQARATAGTAAIAPLLALAWNDRLTGNGPTDPIERNEWLQTHQPNSVRVGDNWHSYQVIQPFAIPMAAVANAYESWKFRDKERSDLPMLFARTGMRLANTTLDQSFLSGMNSLMEALNAEQDTKVASMTGRVLSSYVPFSGALRSIASATDPVMRRPRTVADYIKVGIPGLSQTVEPRLDTFGQERQKPGSGATRAFDVTRTFPVTAEPVRDALTAAGVRIGTAEPVRSMTINGVDVPIPADQGLEFGKAKGQAIYALLKPIIDNPGFQRLPKEYQQKLLEKMITQARERVSTRARGAIQSQQPLTLQGLLGQR